MTANKDECAEAARKVGLPGFAFGKEEAVGECYGETIFVTQDYFDKYKIDHKNPAPACGNKNNCPPKCEWLEEERETNQGHQSENSTDMQPLHHSALRATTW